MNKSTFSLALRIALLMEEFSERELREAASLIEARGGGSFLLDYISGGSTEKKSRVSKKASGHRKDVIQSKVLSELKLQEPEKFRLLFEFEAMLRRGAALATFEDVKRFGEQLSKEFVPRKSRKESISPLIALIADRPLNEIRKIIDQGASFDGSANADEYQRLGKFLVKGKEG